ncbi:DUF4870 domain-containing protein [Phycicoccus sp. MAQZ13P-2]|uniref:DUF4870 domain-containing protein n=1 Tax=Phycicoccus mangrovi TaxID=2840470 RepID=UPI001C00848A|nr:DUF4870 domain-containing protein [Phycicoccus mangrovi]MBT9258054.1 DUF4870 domain-containing protein [Phycicoccus mangrovi]MBT9276265.1 DUF4870 domain-containing protein [Phycicoccus mangrovi]
MSENTPRDDVPRDEPTQSVPPPPAGPPAPPAAPAPTPGWETPAAGEVPPPPPQPQYAQQQYGQQQYGQPAYGQPQYASAAPLTAQEEKTWALLSHAAGLVAMVVSAGTLGFVGSLVIYLVYKDRGPFVRAHAANSLNIQITTAIGVVVSFILMFVLVGFVTIFLVGIYAFVMHIIGMVKANNGEWWNPPFTPRFVK